MLQENGLEIPKRVTKLFVTINNEKWLNYYMGYFGIYVGKVQCIIKDGPSTNRPTIITVNYEDDEWLDKSLEGIDTDIGCKRIFKSAVLPIAKKDKIQAFMGSCAANLLGLAKGKTIKIDCDNIELRNKFYKVFQTVNEKKNKCKFDYDICDVIFHIKEYTSNGKYYIITYVDGLKG
jgi:hypothetical protein